MALNERLQILVTADGKGAVSEFQKIGATAERELGRTDDRIARLSSGLISNGTQVALAGGIATAGVFALAKAAGDYEEAASAAGVIFGDSAEAIEDFGKKAIDTAGLSRRAAVEASNTFGTFGKAAGLAGPDLAEFSTELTQLAGDLASFKNTTTDEAITAIGAALRGESEPIRQYGVLLDDATLKQEALSLGIYDGNGALTQQQKVLAAQSAIFKQTTDAQGDYLRTADSLSNQTRSFTAEIENLKVGLGEGAVPVFSELVGAANDALSAFQNLSPETQDIVGKIGAIGAVGVTAVGGLAIVGGGVLRLVDTFGTLRGRLTDVNGDLTRTGKVASTTGKVLGGAVAVGGVLLLADALFQLTQNSGLAQEALDRFKIDAPRGDAQRTLSTLNALGDSYKDLGDALLEPLVGSPVVKTSDEFGVSLANIDRAINDLYKSGDIEGARTALAALSEVKVRPDNAAALDDINAVIDKYTPKLDAAAATTGGFATKLDSAGNAAKRGANLITGAQEATVDFAADLDDANKLLKLSADLFDLTADRAGNFQDRLEGSTGLDDTLIATLDLTEATWDLGRALDGLSGNFDVSDIAAGIGTVYEDQAGALRDIASVGDQAQQVIAGVLQFQGADAAIARADDLRSQFVGMFEAAGYTQDQIAELLELMGLADWQIEAAITLSGADEAIAKLQLLRDFLENPDGTSGIPKEIETQVSIAISEGRFVDAANLIQIWLDDRQDGLIENPLLIALGLGDTAPASTGVEQWKQDEEKKRPADVPVGANTGPATTGVTSWFQWLTTQRGSVVVDVLPRYDNGLIRLLPGVPSGFVPFGGDKRGGSDGNPATPYAFGGMAEAGQPGWANEPSLGGELFVPSTDGFVMNAGDTDRLIKGVEALVNGSSNMTVNQTITAPDPVTAGSESVRKFRDAQHLAA